MDRRCSDPSDQSRESTVSLRGLFDACCLLDSFRYLHPSTPGFTRTKWNGALASRIDLIDISFLWVSSVTSCSVLLYPFSDHCGVLISFSNPDSIPPGPGLWKLNTAILREAEYVKLISDFWQSWRASRKHFSSVIKWWDDGKSRLKGLTINYCKERYSADEQNRDVLVNLMSHLKAEMNAGSASVVAPYQSALSAHATLDRETARGAQVRSRVRWIEKGELCAAYFVRLEEKHRVDR